jgi:hypothetical protein|nr:MAG TPA: hypothetical protein [Caudoviricetes sp.]
MKPDNRPLPKVSAHAVERYCQRVLGVKVHFYGPELERSLRSNEFRALRHCEAAGLTYNQVVDLILRPNVVMACRGGFRQMRTADFIAVFGNGCVVTIKARRQPGPKVGYRVAYEEHRRCR